MDGFANFPYEIVEAKGEDALAVWEELKRAGRGAPVVLGVDALYNLLAPFEPEYWGRREPVETILAAAERIKFPDDLRKFRRDENAEASVRLGLIASLEDYKEYEAPVGDWPIEPAYGSGLSVVADFTTREYRPIVPIALIPTDDPTAIPAYMRWGEWNLCPSPAYHVAALRAWRDRYGAELIGLSFDVMNLRVSRKPATREEAFALARAHYVFCNDIIDQGVGTYSALAAGLMASDWWFFWWD
jgi:hypothetical protein